MTTTPPVPQPTLLTEPFWSACKQHRLMVQHCEACGSHQFYPRPICIKCSSDSLSWHTCSGRGEVYTYTINHRAASPAFESRTPYAVAVIELEEGVRMFGNIVDSDLAKLQIGSRVSVTFEKLDDDITLPQFRLTP